MCGINAVGAQWSGYMFTFCHAPLKTALLLQKIAKVPYSFSETVYDIFDSVIGIFCQLLTRFDILQAQIASANGFRWYWSKINAYGTLTGHLPEHGK